MQYRTTRTMFAFQDAHQGEFWHRHPRNVIGMQELWGVFECLFWVTGGIMAPPPPPPSPPPAHIKPPTPPPPPPPSEESPVPCPVARESKKCGSQSSSQSCSTNDIAPPLRRKKVINCTMTLILIGRFEKNILPCLCRCQKGSMSIAVDQLHFLINFLPWREVILKNCPCRVIVRHPKHSIKWTVVQNGWKGFIFNTSIRIPVRLVQGRSAYDGKVHFSYVCRFCCSCACLAWLTCTKLPIGFLKRLSNV